MPRSRILFALLAGLLSLATAPDADAQGRARGRRIDRAEVGAIIRRAETASDAFRKKMDARLDRSQLDGTRREDSINEQVKELESALDRLRGKYDKTDAWRESRSEVQDVLGEARDVNRIMEGAAFRAVLEAEWEGLRRDLNTLALTYNLPRLDR